MFFQQSEQLIASKTQKRSVDSSHFAKGKVTTIYMTTQANDIRL